MQDAVSEMQHYNEFDYLVINDNFEVALTDLSQIIYAQRLKLSEQVLRHQSLLNSLI
jgi:guanylate kinase